MNAVSADRRIAIVMITHNRRVEVLRSLGHLSSMPEQPRIVLVDNGSTDDTASAVARQFPRVEILDAGGNLGRPGAPSVCAMSTLRMSLYATTTHGGIPAILAAQLTCWTPNRA